MSLKKKKFMAGKLYQDFICPRKRFEIPNDVTSSELTYYYFKFVEKTVMNKDQRLISRFDEDGIPVNRTYIDVKDQDFVYFPISIGQMGLAIYHSFLKSGSEIDKKRFLNFAEWFKENANLDKTLGVRWLTKVSLPQYMNSGPWQSAFSQSRGISILLRGYQLTQNKDYLDIAEKALIPFLYQVENGGVTSATEYGPFYEEYPASVPTLVLNGMIFSLFGIYDFIRMFPENNIANDIFDKGIKTLENILPQYDMGFWSKYNLCLAEWYPKVDPATIRYQRLHVEQLEVMYRITGKEVFRKYRDKFEKQDNFAASLKMYVIKYKALKKIGRL